MESEDFKKQREQIKPKDLKEIRDKILKQDKTKTKQVDDKTVIHK